jgi:hypothetical protein
MTVRGNAQRRWYVEGGIFACVTRRNFVIINKREEGGVGSCRSFKKKKRIWATTTTLGRENHVNAN